MKKNSFSLPFHSSFTPLSLPLVLSCMVGVNVSAHDIAVPNADGLTIYYNYINNDTELAVTFGEDENTNYKYSGDVVIPEEVTLEGRTLKVTSIEIFTFIGCHELTSVTIPNSVTSIGDFAFCECSGLTSIDIGNGVTSIGNNAFWHCTNLASVTLGNSVASIGVYAFYDCSSLKSITIPPSVTHIGHDVFRNCNDLNAVHISDLEAWCNIQFDDEPFGYYHLYLNGKEIKDLTIPESVTSIGNYAFANCYRLLSITIPDGVTSIGGHAFERCSNLQNIYCHAGQVPETGNNVFGSSIVNATLHVPAASISAYQAVEPWKNFKEIVALEEEMAYRPFIEEGKVWKAGATDSNPVQLVRHFYFDGDTIIDGRTCKRMMCQRYVSPEYRYYIQYSFIPSLSYEEAWYEENQKVYTYNAIDKQFELVYDFSLAANDTMQINNHPYVIGPRQTGGVKGFKGVYRDVMKCVDGGQSIYNNTWLEGVGSVSGTSIVDYGFEMMSEGPKMILMSCTVGDEIIYLNDAWEDGATPGGIKDRKRFDFTHTIKTQPKAPIKRVKNDACISSSEREVARPEVKAPRKDMGARTSSSAEEGQTLYGEYNDQQLSINLNPLDEAYTVYITDESGKVAYEKSINAGNIVGLSIDISTYAAGRYTVTVENGQESFTGVFEAQTTGISDAERLNDKGKMINDNGEMINNSIYNLQGQRLSTLQKGLNIINGQKVYVK